MCMLGSVSGHGIQEGLLWLVATVCSLSVKRMDYFREDDH